MSEKFYKIIIGVLVGIIVLQFVIFLAVKKPAEKRVKPVSTSIPPIKVRIERPVRPKVQSVPHVPAPDYTTQTTRALLGKGKIAIILDDWGYNLNNFSILEQIKVPLTLSILPNLAYSETVSQKAKDSGFQIMLHLPSEPMENIPLEENTILTSMNDKTIKGIVNSDLNSLLNVSGVNNHMGSKVTRDSKTLSIILGELKKRNLYFVDSYVMASSLGQDVASKMKIPFAKRDVFLDNKADYEYIRQQLNKLALKAKINGFAVGIGHDRKTTLEVLRDYIPELEKDGITFVFASELVK